MMYQFTQEHELVPKIVGSSPNFKFYSEVPLFTKMIDLYAIDSLGHPHTYAYELKLNNWKRGLDQAVHYLLAADFVYLAVPMPVALRVVEQMLPRLGYWGIGVLGIDGKVEEVFQPAKSSQLSLSCKNRILEFLNGRPDKEVHANGA